LKHDQPWAKAGHEFAWDEFKLPDAAPPEKPKARPEVKLLVETNELRIVGKDFEMRFDNRVNMSPCTIRSWRYQGVELIEKPLRPDFWRAETDNDRGRNSKDAAQRFWRKAHEGFESSSFKVVNAGVNKHDYVELEADWHLPNAGDATWTTSYRVYGSGDVVVTAHFKPGKTDLPKLPRLGLQMALPKGFERITWFGPGPEETYSDRKESKLGIYSGSVDEQFYKSYTIPGESGNKVDVRWATLTNDKGIGLLAVGMPLLSVNALHYTTDDLSSARHAFEMTRRDFITL